MKWRALSIISTLYCISITESWNLEKLAQTIFSLHGFIWLCLLLLVSWSVCQSVEKKLWIYRGSRQSRSMPTDIYINVNLQFVGHASVNLMLLCCWKDCKLEPFCVQDGSWLICHRSVQQGCSSHWCVYGNKQIYSSFKQCTDICSSQHWGWNEEHCELALVVWYFNKRWLKNFSLLSAHNLLSPRHSFGCVASPCELICFLQECREVVHIWSERQRMHAVKKYSNRHMYVIMHFVV